MGVFMHVLLLGAVVGRASLEIRNEVAHVALWTEDLEGVAAFWRRYLTPSSASPTAATGFYIAPSTKALKR